MTTARTVVLFTVFVAACSGASSDPTDRATTTSSSSSSSSGSTCSAAITPGQGVCTMSDAASGSPLAIEVQYTSSHCESKPTCEVALSGNIIKLSLTQEICSGGGEPDCMPQPGMNKARCNLPALGAGSYQIEFGSTYVATVPLGVSADGKRTSCTIEPAQLSLGEAPVACENDDDCVTVATGDVCSSCTCTPAAIARSGLAAHRAREETAMASCVQGTSSPKINCAVGCTYAKAHCAEKKCTLQPG